MPSRPATADEFATPGITFARVEWRAVLDQLKGEISTRPDAEGFLTFSRGRRLPRFDQRRAPALVQLNAVMSAHFAGIDQSPVPVLLPFDNAAYLADRLAGAPSSLTVAHYQSGFRAADLFEAGPAGYDAVFALEPGANNNLPARTFARAVEVHLTGSILTYDIDDPNGGKGEPVKALAGQYPDLRKFIREGFLRYAFTRFGVPYVVSIQCLDSVPRSNRLACREAAPVAEYFLKRLRVVGGRLERPRANIAVDDVMRPVTPSPDFTYHPPGELIANSGYHGEGGKADHTAYAQIRFPLEQAPAFANSQSFMNWGDCYQKGRTPTPRGKGDAYHCKLNDKPLVLDEAAGGNYAYPWQDNFCETRDFNAGQCPGGFGHQGQDIRPSSCTTRNEGSDRCVPDIYTTVAVRDGVLIRSPKQQAALVLVNSRNEHVRFRYMHMEPARMDSDGVLSGRQVSEGEKIGVASNYQDYAGGTTTHLHFDVQVFTPDGWIWVNPYATLITSYERLLGARGRQIEPPANPSAPVVTISQKAEGGDNAGQILQP